MESEEVWGLSNTSGWVMKQDKDKCILPIWPYEILANKCKSDVWRHHSADAVSLEYFVYKLLPIMIERGIEIEILPTDTRTGNLLQATELAGLFTGILETEDYYLEG
jgi:hypothetical protein